MASFADDLRRTLRQKAQAEPPERLLALTARLADADVDLYCAANGVSREMARRVFVRQRQTGRRPSRVMQERAE